MLNLNLYEWISETALWHGASLVVEERPRQAGLPGCLCDQEGHKNMECAHLALPSIDTYRIIDLCDQGGNAPCGDFTHIGLGGELDIN